MHVLPVILVFIALVLVGVTLVVYQQTSDVQVAVNLVEHERFVKSIAATLDRLENKNPGAEETLTFRASEGVQTICFTKEESVAFPWLSLQQQLHSEKNVFFQPSDYSAASLSFSLDESPLCISSPFSLSFTRKRNSTLIRGASLPHTCEALSLNEDATIDLAFIGQGYNNENVLASDVHAYLSTLFSIDPFSSHEEKFNVYMNPTPFEDCSVGSYIQCDSTQLKKAAASCPHDYFFLLVDRSLLGSLTGTRSSAVDNYAKIDTSDNTLVLVHEFAHVFADLYDEYEDDSYYAAFGLTVDNIPNCAELPCDKWSGVLGTSCSKDCTLSSLYRSTDNSLMRNYYIPSGKTFGPWNEQLLEEQLGEHS